MLNLIFPIGTTIFLLTFASGLIIIQNPLQLIEAQFITISIFILASLIIIALVVYDSIVNLYEVLALLSLFIVFFSINIVVHHKMKVIYKKRLKLSDDIQNELVQEELMTIITEVVQLKQMSFDSDVERQDISDGTFSGWTIFIRYMTPFCMKRYKRSGKVLKGLFIIQTPFYLILLLLIPKVDYTSYQRNWSKYNYLFVLLVYPVIASFSLNGTKFLKDIFLKTVLNDFLKTVLNDFVSVWDIIVIEIPGIFEVFVIHVIFFACLTFSVLIMCTSSMHRAPPYFNVRFFRLK